MGNYSQLIFYGCVILLLNNIGDSDGTFFGLLGQASNGLHQSGATSRAATDTSTRTTANVANNDVLLNKLTQISSKLSLLLNGLGNANANGATIASRTGTIQMTSTVTEISPKIDDDVDEVMKKDDEPDYVVEEHKEDDSEKDDVPAANEEAETEDTENEERGNKISNGNGQKATNGRKQNDNRYELRKSISTSNSGRAASINTGARKTVVRVQPSGGSVVQNRANFSPGVLAAISTSGGYTYQNQPSPVVQQTYYQTQPIVERTGGSHYYQTQPVAQQTYYQTQQSIGQRTGGYSQNQTPVQRTGGYNYQSPGYRYRTVRYY